MTFAGLDGEIGKVRQFYFGDQHWAVRYLVADTGNWLTGRQVLISPYALLAVNREEQNLFLLSKNVIRNKRRVQIQILDGNEVAKGMIN